MLLYTILNRISHLLIKYSLKILSITTDWWLLYYNASHPVTVTMTCHTTNAHTHCKTVYKHSFLMTRIKKQHYYIIHNKGTLLAQIWSPLTSIPVRRYFTGFKYPSGTTSSHLTLRTQEKQIQAQLMPKNFSYGFSLLWWIYLDKNLIK